MTTVSLDSTGSRGEWSSGVASSFISVDLHQRLLLFQYDKFNEISSKTSNLFSVAEEIGYIVVKVDIYLNMMVEMVHSFHC